MRVKNTLVTLLVLVLAGYGALKLYVFYRAKDNFQQILYCAGMPRMPANVPRSSLFDYDHISASVFGPIGIRGLKIRVPNTDEEIRIGEVLLTYDYEGDLARCPTPRHINVSINDMTFNVSLLDEMEKQREEFKRQRGIEDDPVPELVSRLGFANLYTHATDFHALGYDQLNLDISFDLAFDSDNKEATFNVHEKVKDLGDMNFKFTVAGMANNINSAVLGVKIKQAEIRFHDASYVNRLFKMFAANNKQDVTAYRKALIAGLAADFNANQIKLGDDSMKNLTDFLADPKQLIMTMYPYEPVGIESIKMYKPGDVPMLLNLQIYTK